MSLLFAQHWSLLHAKNRSGMPHKNKVVRRAHDSHAPKQVPSGAKQPLKASRVAARWAWAGSAGPTNAESPHQTAAPPSGDSLHWSASGVWPPAALRQTRRPEPPGPTAVTQEAGGTSGWSAVRGGAPTTMNCRASSRSRASRAD